jgi:hypothetical protein
MARSDLSVINLSYSLQAVLSEQSYRNIFFKPKRWIEHFTGISNLSSSKKLSLTETGSCKWQRLMLFLN